MRDFVNRHLDPSTRLGELLFGLIMALGITGAVRFGMQHVSNRELLVAILGCNVAWGIVDGVMFAMLAMFERGRKERVIRYVIAAPNDEVALERIHGELGGRLEPFMTPEERREICLRVLATVRKCDREPPRLQRQDVLGGIAIGLLIILATMPIVIPFLIFTNQRTAMWASDGIALCELFWAGNWWGRLVGASPLRIGTGVTAVGLALVLITIALGG
jgi:hypothetical protein